MGHIDLQRSPIICSLNQLIITIKLTDQSPTNLLIDRSTDKYIKWDFLKQVTILLLTSKSDM